MLDDLNELKTFQQVMQLGSLTAAAKSLDVSLAVVSKRLATLEKRVGIRLLNRTTRTLSATEAGERLVIDVERALQALHDGELVLKGDQAEPYGTLRVSAPVSFGRRHVAPVLSRLQRNYPQLYVKLSLDDRLVEIASGQTDVAIRVGGYVVGAGAAMRKLADNRRILVATADYLDRKGRPVEVDDLLSLDVLRYGDVEGPWRLVCDDGRERLVAVSAPLRVNSGDVIRDWCLEGAGVMLKSEIDVATDLRAGLLERVLPEWHGGDTPIVALFPDRVALPAKSRVFLDQMIDAMRAAEGSELLL